jgi:hypothetical protein
MNWIIRQTIDLTRGFPPANVWPDVLMIPGDGDAHVWEIAINEMGQPANLDGYSVSALFVREDKNSIYITGNSSGNIASVTLTQQCYAIAGQLRGIMRISKNGNVLSACETFFSVREPVPNQYIDPGEIIPSLEELLAQMDALEQLEEDVSAAEAERIAAEQAREAAFAQFKADIASGEYNGATFIPGMSAEGVLSWTNDKGLPNPASVNIKGADGLSVELRLSDAYLQWRPVGGAWQNLVALSAITGPAGENGTDGQNPTISIGTVTRAETTSEASATLTGTYPAYVLNLVLPKGDTGATGATGPTGPKGDDGVSPTISVSKSGKITTITIVDAEGSHTATINDGADGSGAGDMLAATYDTDGDGIVDDAEKLGGQLPSYYAKAADMPSVPAWALSNTKPTYTAQEVGAAAAEHTHEQGDIAGLTAALSGKAAVEHTHEQVDIAGLSNALAGKASTEHTHEQEDIVGLTDALAGKAAAEHTHTQSDVTGLETALAGKVNAESGKGLSTNDYTTSEKDKLAGIEAGANNYVHPSTHPASMIAAGTLAGQVQANATAVESLATAQVRNIRAGTADLTPGESALASGEVYLVYE